MKNANQKEPRSIRLDPSKVKKHAALKGFHSFDSFKIEYEAFVGNEKESTIPKKLWKGIQVDKKRAMDVAHFLGLSNYDPLLLSIPDLIFPKEKKWIPEQSTPGGLLKAEYQIVPFHNRFDEINDLDAWCKDDLPVAVRLYTGIGGMGKTRLAIEICSRLNETKKWTTGFLRENKKATIESYEWLKGITQETLIVIDYAEERGNEVPAILEVALESSEKVRIVLLARAAVDWWRKLKTKQSGVGELIMSSSTSWIALQPLALSLDKREKSYFIAADNFAKQLQKEVPLQPPRDLNAKHYERVLLLHMQALINVNGETTENDDQKIYGLILLRERKFWDNHARKRKIQESLIPSISTAMAMITSIGGVQNKQEALDCLEKIPLLKDARIDVRVAIVDLLHDLYPCNLGFEKYDIDGCNYIEPLQPDLLGEHLMQEELNRDAETMFSILGY